MREVELRLQRLVKSDVCQADTVEGYREELVALAQKVADVKTVKRQSKFFKALSDAKRLSILKLLRVKEMCICELMIALNTTQPNLSHHIQILENAGLVNRTKKGKWVYCSLTNKEVIENITNMNIK
jgi:ArsR family transcriptional regulator